MSIWRAGDTAGVGTVVRTFRSAPRPPGASMVVAPDGTVSGSVSGGCVEGAVYELATEVARTGTPVLERYGVSDDDAFAVGLTCGGILDIFVEPMSQATFPELGAVADDIGEHRAVAVATVIAHPDRAVGWAAAGHPAGRRSTGSLGSARADAAVDRRRARSARGGAQRGARLRARRPAARRRHGGVRRQLRPAPADAGVRCHRLRRRGRAAGIVPRLPRHGVRRPSGVRHAGRGFRRPTRWSSTGRTATWPRRPRRAPSTAHGDLRAHPRSEVRRPAARGGAATARGRAMSVRWGRAARTTTGSSGCARRG